MPDFQVLGRQLPLLPTSAEEKLSSSATNTPATTSPPAPTPSTTVGGAGPTTHGAAASPAAGLAPGGGVHHTRRSSRAAAVAATVAAVASAKAATDDAVASVSSSGRHRSIGTSISDTLVITARPGAAAGEAGVVAVADRPSGGGDRSGSRHRPAASAWPEPAPGKDDGGRGGDHGRGVAAALGVVAAGDRHRTGGDRQAEDASAPPTAGHYDNEHKWHKHVTGGAAASVEGGGVDDKARDRRDTNSSVGGGVGSGSRGQDTTADEKGAGRATSSVFVTNPWSQDLRGGILGVGEAGKSGGGGDSPPLLGSPDPAPPAAAAAATAVVASPPPPEKNNPPFFPSSSRRSPNAARQRELSDAVVGRSSIVGFPVTAGADADASCAAGADAARRSPPSGLRLKKEISEDESGKAVNAADMFSEADGGGGGGGGGGSGELGMTRPRTATRRWDRPGPPGDDEVIGKTLLSRASVTSTLSTR